jgi:hypothetical protein
MAKIKGNSLLVYVNDVAIGCLNDNEFTSENSDIPTTCKDNDGQETSLPGGNTASISFSGTYDTAAAYGLSQLIDIHKNKTEIGVRMGVAGSSGLYIQSSSAYLNSLTWSGPLNAATVFSGNFKLNNWSKGTHT